MAAAPTLEHLSNKLAGREVSREDLVRFSQQGAGDLEQLFLGIDKAQSMELGRVGLQIADDHFKGNAQAAVNFLVENGQKPEFAGKTVAEIAADPNLADIIAGKISDAQVASTDPNAAVAAAETGTAATSVVDSLFTPEQKARMKASLDNINLQNVFNSTSGGGFDISSMEGMLDNLSAVLEKMMASFSGGANFSLADLGETITSAFEGITMDGKPFPETATINSENGQPVADPNATPVDPEVAVDTNAAPAMQRSGIS